MELELNSLRLRNFRSHRKLDLTFRSGITGITGVNGAGKSSIVEAILFLFWDIIYGDKKELVISNGETSGYVAGTFTLNGKKGKLERHLDATKTILEYDGQTKKKATEVKEFWDSLLQVTPDIGKNIIVAKQGEIALLFNGTNAVREPIFQKIFLVPNTTKIRTLMYDKYISCAPAPFATQKPEDLQAILVTCQKTEADKKLLMDACRIIEQTEFEEEYKKQQAFQKQIDDYARRIKVVADLEQLKTVLTPLQNEVNALTEKLASIDVQDYRNQIVELNRLKVVDATHQKILATLADTEKYLLPEDQYHKAVLREDADRVRLTNLQNENNVLKAKHKEIASELVIYRGVKGHANCPTCHQSILDIQKLIVDREAKLQEVASQFKDAEIEELRSVHQKVAHLIQTQRNFRAQKEALDAQLKDNPAVHFDPKDLDFAVRVVEKYVSLETDLNTKKETMAKMKARVPYLEAELSNLVDGINPTYAADAIKESKALVDKLNLEVEDRNKAVIAYKYAQMATAEAEKNIEANKVVLAKNKKRDDYLAKLAQVYEALHTTQFPRKLIQSYSDIVSEYLGNYLAKFSIPYTAIVNDNFGIDVMDESGRKLPLVSGGQQIIVGLCLRLALHELFGQSFPMLIIDEGSQALHDINLACYFEVIRGLKTSSHLKQIIVIDHHYQLKDVVDNSIEL